MSCVKRNFREIVPKLFDTISDRAQITTIYSTYDEKGIRMETNSLCTAFNTIFSKTMDGKRLRSINDNHIRENLFLKSVILQTLIIYLVQVFLRFRC